jgi:hypothetical protein
MEETDNLKLTQCFPLGFSDILCRLQVYTRHMISHACYGAVTFRLQNKLEFELIPFCVQGRAEMATARKMRVVNNEGEE